MATREVTIVVLPSPRTRPLLDEEVTSRGSSLRVTGAAGIDENSRAMANLEFDLAEVSIATYLRARDQGIPLIGLPIFASARNFPQSSFQVSVRSAITRPLRTTWPHRRRIPVLDGFVDLATTVPPPDVRADAAGHHLGHVSARATRRVTDTTRCCATGWRRAGGAPQSWQWPENLTQRSPEEQAGCVIVARMTETQCWCLPSPSRPPPNASITCARASIPSSTWW